MSEINKLRILFVEDVPIDMEIASRELKRNGFQFESRRVETKDTFLIALEDFAPDIVISDYSLPEFDGMKALKLTRSIKPLIPFILLTGSLNEETAVKCMKAGATDYVLKEQIARLPFAVKDAIKQKKILAEKEITEAALKESEAKFRRIAENAHDLIYRYELEPARRFTYVSPAATQITGYTPKEHYDDPDLGIKIIHPDDQNIFQLIIDGNLSWKSSTVLRLIRKDGSVIWTEQRNVPIYDEEGKLIAIEGIARDITESKLTEVQIKKMNRMYHVLSNINQTIVRTREMPLLFNEVCRIAVEDGKFTFAWIGIFNNESQELDNMYYHLLAQDRSHIDSDFIKKNCLGKYTRKALTTGVHFVCNDVKKGINLSLNDTKSQLPGISSYASFPLIVFSKVKGIFNLYSSEINFFNDDEVRLLDELTMDISFSIEFSEREMQREKTEKALHDSEERFRTLYENSTIGLYRTSPAGEILLANPTLLRLLGFPSFEELSSRNLSKEGYEFNYDRKKFLDTIEEKGEVIGFESSWRQKDGKIIYVRESARAVRDSSGKTIYYDGTVEDITERKLAEEHLLKSEREYRNLFESANDAIIIFEPEQEIILAVNKKACELYGFSSEEFIGMTLKNISEDMDTGEQRIQRIMNGDQIQSFETVHFKNDGTPIDILVSASRIEYNQQIAIQSINRDITERKLAEKNLIKAKEEAELSNRLKSEFLAQMSHEIRTPLNVITSNIGFINELVLDKIEEEYQDCFQSIDLASNRIIRTVDLILNMSELQTGSYKPSYTNLDLNSTILNKLYAEYQRAAKFKGLNLTYKCMASEPVITGDEYSVTQIFANLIDNAIKYTKEGKVNIILSQNEEGKKIVEIEDTGIGIAKEFIPRLFDMFAQEEQGYTRTYEGNGLGLALVKRYCGVNNADIQVESRKNLGSVFRVIFNKK